MARAPAHHAELLRALARLAEPPTPETEHLWTLLGLGETPPTASDHTETFVFQLPPYASIHLGEEGMLGGDARDRISGFFRALGAEVPQDPDHLSVLLAAYAELVERESAAVDDQARAGWRRSRAALFWEHLASWLPSWLIAVQRAGHPVHQEWSALLNETLVAEARLLGSPTRLPLSFREVPPLADPRQDGASEFLASLLASARTGMILTRSDLAGAARALGLGLRIGERSYILRALVDQDTAGVLDWLADFAEAHPLPDPAFGPVRDSWRDRAAHTAALLRDLAAESRDALQAAAAS